MIKHIKLENFKRVTSFETDLDRINVLVGANNSGKSSVLQGVQFTIMAEVIRRVMGRDTIPQEKLLYLPSADFSVLRHGSEYSNYSGLTSSLQLQSDTASDGQHDDEFSITLSKGRNYGNISVHASGNNKFRTSVTSSKELYCAYTPGLSGIPYSEKQVSPAVLRNAAANGDANLYLRNIIYYIKEQKNLRELNQLVNSVFPSYRISVPYDHNNDTTIIVNVNIGGHEIPLELCGTGVLQIIQIMAYSIYFKPKLLLLDEPDEHLHPNNQILLCNAIQLLSTKMDLQVIMSTHSRHVISALESEARFIWMKNGEVCCDEQSSNLHNVLLDLGALDAYDSILQGIFSLVVLTEDSDTKYLKKLLEYNGCDMTTTLIIPYNSSSHIDAAIQLANFIKSSARTCKIIIHRDRDFMTDDEVQVIKDKFEEEEQLLWITDECDVEAYFTTVEHIAALTEKSVDEVIEWQKDFLIENHVDIQHKFEEKRRAISATMYNSDRKLKKNKDVSWPSFDTLFGKTIPTLRQNVVGKFMLKKCNENMSKLCKNKIDLLTKTDSLVIASLQDLINKA